MGFNLNLGLTGIWLGRIAAGVINTVTFLILLLKVDLDDEMQNIQKRLEKTEKYRKVSDKLSYWE